MHPRVRYACMLRHLAQHALATQTDHKVPAPGAHRREKRRFEAGVRDDDWPRISGQHAREPLEEPVLYTTRAELLARMYFGVDWNCAAAERDRRDERVAGAHGLRPVDQQDRAPLGAK